MMRSPDAGILDTPAVTPRFSVVIPAHNSASLVGDAIRSVLAQTRQDFEVIVVDDGSVDDTAARVSAFEDPRITLIRQPNRGPSSARNAGIDAARGTYVCMLDSDDMLLPGYLEAMGGALDAAPYAGLAYTDAYVLDSKTGRVRRTSMMHYQHPPRTPPRDSESLFRLLLVRNFVYTAATVRRGVLAQVGGFDERLWTAEEWELWLRIAAAGFAAVRPPGILGIHRLRAGSLSADLPRMFEGVCEVYRIVAEEWPEVADDVRDDARALRRRRLRQLELLRDAQAPRTMTERLLEQARRVRQPLHARRLWLDVPPPQVVALVAAATEASWISREPRTARERQLRS